MARTDPFFLTPDKQTRAIHRLQRQRRRLEGRLLARERSDVVKLHQNAQRLLKNIEVVNPFAPALTFVDDKTRTRRDHMKYLQLIEAIAFLHQHQRPLLRAEQNGKAFDYVEVTVEDIRLANRLAHTALGRSLDELPPQTRKLLDAIDAYVVEVCKEKNVTRDQVRLSRRELLDVTGLALTQLRVHLQRLVDLEHVLVHSGSRGQSFVYELVFDGKGRVGVPHLSGLIDVDALDVTTSATTIPTWRGPPPQSSTRNRRRRRQIRAISRPARTSVRTGLRARSLRCAAAKCVGESEVKALKA